MTMGRTVMVRSLAEPLGVGRWWVHPASPLAQWRMPRGCATLGEVTDAGERSVRRPGIPADAGRDHPGPEVAPDPSDPAFGAETGEGPDPSFGAETGEGPDPSFGPEAAEEERVDYGESDGLVRRRRRRRRLGAPLTGCPWGSRGVAGGPVRAGCGGPACGPLPAGRSSGGCRRLAHTRHAERHPACAVPGRPAAPATRRPLWCGARHTGRR